MATAGFNGDLDVSTDDSTYNTIGDVTEVSSNLQRSLEEITVLGDTAVDRLPMLKDSDFSITVLADDTDTQQGVLDSALDGGTTVYLRHLYDGTNGFKVECYVESVSYGSTPDGVATKSYTCMGRDAWTRVP